MDNVKKLARQIVTSKLFPLIIIMVIIVVFYNSMNPGYLGKSNILILFKSMSLTGVLGVGAATLLISGEIDLSMSAVTGLAGVLCAMLLSAGMPWPLAVLITIFFGIVAGALNAFLVNVLDMMSFIATIGSSSVIAGLALVVTRANPVKFKNDEFLKLGTTAFMGVIPLAFIIMFLLVVVYALILWQTKFGRSIYMCGGNRSAARLAGISPKKIHALLFINSGAISALGGVLFCANMRKGDPTPITNGMDAITAAILGGISFSGGAGSTGGMLVGLMLLTLFNNGLTVVRVKSYWQIIAQGMLLLLALTLDFYRENRRLKMLLAGAAEVVESKRA